MKSEEYLEYHPDTGNIFWKKSTSNVAAGSLAGGINPKGYRCLTLRGKNYLAHRVAWFLHYGE